MGVFRDIEVEYGGRKYTLTPSNRLLRRIEGEVGSILDVMSRTGAAKPPVSEIAFIVCEFLTAAGVRGIDEDEIYGELMLDLVQGGGEQFGAMCEVIGMAVSPAEMDPKKQPAPAKPRKKAGGKAEK